MSLLSSTSPSPSASPSFSFDAGPSFGAGLPTPPDHRPKVSPNPRRIAFQVDRFIPLVIAFAMLTAWTGAACAIEPLSIEAQPQAPADANPEPTDLTYTPNWPEPPNTGAMLLRLGIGTAVVLVLCVGSLWVGKPWLQKLQGVTTANPLMRVQGSVTLGSRAVLHLIKVGDTQLVAGTDATGLKSLVVIPASFREVLDSQLPVTDQIVPPTEFFDLRPAAVAGSKE